MAGLDPAISGAPWTRGSPPERPARAGRPGARVTERSDLPRLFRARHLAEHLSLSLSPDTGLDDLVQPFRIDPFALRGRLVRLGPAIDRILSQHAYPEPVAAMLGEAITLAVVLAGALKYDGVFNLQIQGDGPIPLMVADLSTTRALRRHSPHDAATPPTAGVLA